MSYHQRPHELRLAISTEAEALMISFGDQAYAEACLRAEEASSDFLARDWNEVAHVGAQDKEAPDVARSCVSLIRWHKRLPGRHGARSFGPDPAMRGRPE
jgi:hypothetical protein